MILYMFNMRQLKHTKHCFRGWLRHYFLFECHTIICSWEKTLIGINVCVKSAKAVSCLHTYGRWISDSCLKSFACSLNNISCIWLIYFIAIKTFKYFIIIVQYYIVVDRYLFKLHWLSYYFYDSPCICFESFKIQK